MKILKWCVVIALVSMLGVLSCKDDDVKSPVIISFSPESGSPADSGTVVMITGSNFGLTPLQNTVTFSGVPATVTASTSTLITTAVPQGATTGKIGVTVNGISAVSDADFIVTPTNVWEPVAEFPGAWRLFSIVFSIGDKGYFGGGDDAGGSPLKDFWEYDSKTDKWTRIEDFGGGGRLNAVAFSIGERGYVGTGSAIGAERFKDMWEYDPATNHWTRKDDFGGTPRESAVSIAIGNKGYIGGGFSDLWEKDFWEFNPSAATGQQWTKKKDIGVAENEDILPGSTSFAIETKGYFHFIIKGKVDLLEYHPESDLWTKKKSLPDRSPNSYSAFTLGKKGYVMGNNKLWRYDPVTDEWVQKKEFPTSTIDYPVSFAAGKNGYVVGHDYGTGDFSRKLCRYIPD